MPIHDWTRVDAGIFHHFHHGWIEDLSRALNRGLLPPDHYALAEQIAGATDIKVVGGQLEARAQRLQRLQHLQAPFGLRGDLGLRWQGEQRVGAQF